MNQDAFRAAFLKKGLNLNPSLIETSIAQRLAFGSRLNTIPLRRTFRQQAGSEAISPELARKEMMISRDVERSTGRGGPDAPGARVSECPCRQPEAFPERQAIRQYHLRWYPGTRICIAGVK